MDFCLRYQKDCSFTNLRRLPPDTDETRPYVRIYRWRGWKGLPFGGIEKGNSKGVKGRPSRGFEDIRQSTAWLKDFETPPILRRRSGPEGFCLSGRDWRGGQRNGRMRRTIRSGKRMKCREKRRKNGNTRKCRGDRGPRSGRFERRGLSGRGQSCRRILSPLFRDSFPQEVSSRLFPPEEGHGGGRLHRGHRAPPGGGAWLYGGVPGLRTGNSRPSGGIVILGGPGVGKSTLAKRLVDTLVEFHVIPGRTRTRTTVHRHQRQGSGGPVYRAHQAQNPEGDHPGH